MNDRQARILQAIVEEFLKTANPVGSQYLHETHDFDVSPATIRNDMASLEDEGLIYQPHTSAGRVPTGAAYRNFVDALAIDEKTTQLAHLQVQKVYEKYHLQKFKERLYDLVAILAQTTGNISFATLPDKERVFYLGISHVLRQPEFMGEPEKASRVVEVLENDLYKILQELKVDDRVSVSIGEENLVPAMHSCTLLAKRYLNQNYAGIMGILGPTRMNYAYNIAVLKEVVGMF